MRSTTIQITYMVDLKYWSRPHTTIVSFYFNNGGKNVFIINPSDMIMLLFKWVSLKLALFKFQRFITGSVLFSNLHNHVFTLKIFTKVIHLLFSDKLIHFLFNVINFSKHWFVQCFSSLYLRWVYESLFNIFFLYIQIKIALWI